MFLGFFCTGVGEEAFEVGSAEAAFVAAAAAAAHVVAVALLVGGALDCVVFLAHDFVNALKIPFKKFPYKKFP